MTTVWNPDRVMVISSFRGPFVELQLIRRIKNAGHLGLTVATKQHRPLPYSATVYLPPLGRKYIVAHEIINISNMLLVSAADRDRGV